MRILDQVCCCGDGDDGDGWYCKHPAHMLGCGNSKAKLMKIYVKVYESSIDSHELRLLAQDMVNSRVKATPIMLVTFILLFKSFFQLNLMVSRPCFDLRERIHRHPSSSAHASLRSQQSQQAQPQQQPQPSLNIPDSQQHEGVAQHQQQQQQRKEELVTPHLWYFLDEYFQEV